MKKIYICLLACFALLFINTVTFAGADNFAGSWKNVDTNTGGITRINIKVDGDNARVQAWGKCHPKDCDWGMSEGIMYGPTASSNIIAQANTITAQYKSKGSSVLLLITQAGSNKLKVESYTRFDGRDRRSNYAAVYTFKRAQKQAEIPSKPVLPVKEDCLSFNPKNAAVVQVKGRWKIVDGNHSMFDFGKKKDEADQALKIIKRYQMDQSCFVGRPDPSMQYMLISGRAPVGGLREEDCVSFNPSTTEVKEINGRWKIVDGNHGVFDFEGNRVEAKRAFNIIKQYRFNKSCFVGRPNPSFQYLRR